MRYQINLLPPRDNNITDRIIYFSFHYLRYILVITQLVVIGVFFYRFQIDQQVVDLRDSIKQKSEIITVSNSLLKEMKTIDTKMQSIGIAVNNQGNLQKMYEYFLSSFPADLYLTKMELKPGEITIEGYTQNINIVKQYHNRLTQDKKFLEIKLESIKREDVNYIFTFSLKKFDVTKS